jgi:DNA-binding transcriptional regulator GbsR (MarR family)
MKKASVSPSMRRVIGFLGELGQRWGLPAESCRVHGYLYLVARPVTDSELGEALGLNAMSLRDALAWLADYRLIERSGASWRTDGDPWDLMLRALEERRRREVEPALAVLHECQQAAVAEDGRDRLVGLQIGKLLALAEDLAAIDTQARRFSPRTLRQLVGFGGRAARLLDRTFGRKGAQ